MALNFPGVPSNGMPRSRARTVFVGAGMGSRADGVEHEHRARAGAGSPTAIAPYTSNKSYRAISGSPYGLDARGTEFILGEERPGAFAFLPHDRGPILGCRIEGVGIHELAPSGLLKVK